jgi:putative sugar O-methyltransferase
MTLRRFNVTGDRLLWNRIVSDLMQHAGELAPAEHWVTLESQASEDHFSHRARPSTPEQLHASYLSDTYWQRFATLEAMLDPFVGCEGMQALDAERLEAYTPFLNVIDHLGLLYPLLNNLPGGEFLVTDLGSIIDLNLMTYPLQATFTDTPRHILEVGGGYGRLAEAYLQHFGHGGCYVLLDAVPSALMYAYLYLRQRFPHKRIGFYYHDDPFDLDAYDAYVMPVWHFPAPASAFDVCVNVESMQEMHQEHINYYFNLFDAACKTGGVVYLSNCHEYVFRGVWPYPAHWRCWFRENTPRSWKRHHPTEVFVKGTGNHALENQMSQMAYQYGLSQMSQHSTAHALGAVTRQLASLDAALSDMASRLEELNAALKMQNKQQALPGWKNRLRATWKHFALPK